MTLRKQAIGGLKWNSVGNIGLAVFQLLQVIILTRILPKEAFGLVAIAVFVVNFTNLFVEMGITSAIFHKQNITKNQYSSLFWLNIVLSILLYLVVFWMAKPIAVFYNQAEIENIVKILGLNLIFISVGKQHRVILQKSMVFNVLAKVDLFSYFIGLVLAISFAWKGFGVYSLVYSTLATSIISSCILIIVRIKKEPIDFYFNFSEISSFLKIGSFSLGSNILDFLSREIDVMIIGRFFGSEVLGVYSLAKQITLRLYALMIPIVFNVFNPLLASLNREKELVEIYYLRILNIIANISFPIYLCVVLAASEILVILYGVDYKEATTLLIFLAVFQVAFTLVKPSGSLQIATGRTDIGFYWTIIRNVLTVSLLYFVSRYNDINLVVIALAVLGWVLIIFMWNIQIKMMTSISFRMYVKQFMFPAIMFILVIAMKYFLIDRVMINNLIISAIVKIIIGCFVYSFGIYLLDRNSANTIVKYIKL